MECLACPARRRAHCYYLFSTTDARRFNKGESEIEQMAERVELRRAHRIVVTFPVRVRFLKMCRAAASEAGTGTKLHRNKVAQLRDEVKEKVDSMAAETLARKFFAHLGFRDRDATLLRVFDHALERIDEIEGVSYLQ